MRERLLRALARHVKLVSWLAVLGWLAWIAGAIASGRRFRPGWLVTLFFIFVATALYGAWVGSRQRMQIREGRLPVLPKRKLPPPAARPIRPTSSRSPATWRR